MTEQQKIESNFFLRGINNSNFKADIAFVLLRPLKTEH